MIKDFLDIVVQLYGKDKETAILLIQATIVGLVLIAGVVLFLVNRDISHVKDKNAELEKKIQELRNEKDALRDNAEKIEDFLNKKDSMHLERIKLEEKLSKEVADSEQKTQEREAIDEFLKKIIQFEEAMTDNLKRIKAGKQLFEEKEDWTEEYIQSKKRFSWKNLLKRRNKPPAR